MTTLTTYALRLPKSIKAEAVALCEADGTSLNQFVTTAVAEKIAVMKTAVFFEARGSRARAAASRGEPSALRQVLSRSAGEPPRAGDELPEGFKPQAPRAASAQKAAAAKSKTQPRRAVKKST